MKHARTTGITLLEMVIFIAILSTILFALISATTHAVKRTMLSQKKIIATHYTDELQEWMRGEKESDWSIFSGRTGTYCFNEDISTCDLADTCWDDNQACDIDDYSLDTFQRSATLTVNGSRTDVSTTVSWRDGPNIFSVPLVTTFSRWE